MSIPSYYFCAVFQCRFCVQMDVFRWILNDSGYRMCAIIHDRDISPDDHEILAPNNETITVRKGDRIPEHYHAIIKVSRRITAESMSKRFGSYVHFEACSDPCQYARYLTHDTFDSRDKVRYESSAIIGDTALYSELIRRAITVDETQVYHRLRIYIERCGSPKDAIYYALMHDDIEVYKWASAHAYFVNLLCK